MRRGLAAAFAVILAALPAQAGMFEDLFAFAEGGAVAPLLGDDGGLSPDPGRFGPRSDAGVCIAAIRQAEADHGIPRDLLLAIGLQEAGISYRGSRTIWPWSLNVAGQGFRFDTRAEAEVFLAETLARGQDVIDVGCLQVNLHWHPTAFPSPAAGFDPARNADYAARFLKQLYQETGDWREAAGRYHSATPDLKQSYLAGVERQLSGLEDTVAALDALVQAAPGIDPSLVAGVTLGPSPRRRMNPLRAPARPGTELSATGLPYRRTLIVLPPRQETADPAALELP